MLANLGHPSASSRRIGADEIMLPDRRGLVRSMVRWPFSFLGALRRYAGHPFTTSLIDGLGALAEGLPQALYTTDGMERYLRDSSISPDAPTGSTSTKRRLLITATDFDYRTATSSSTGAIRDSVPISEAAAASTAIPLLVLPTRDRRSSFTWMVDSARPRTSTSPSLTGPSSFVCINPLVPYVHDIRHLLPSAQRAPLAAHLAERLPSHRCTSVPDHGAGSGREGARGDRARPSRR